MKANPQALLYCVAILHNFSFFGIHSSILFVLYTPYAQLSGHDRKIGRYIAKLVHG
jgi:hypothetical protein